MNTYNLLAFSGSLRKDSYNTRLLEAFKAQAPAGVSIEIADISAIPLYNQDDEANFPEVVAKLKEKIQAADGIIIATPEFNRSIPGALKNMTDYTSRPWGKNAWKGKPVYVIGASSGPIAAALAQYDLKKIMLYLGSYVLGQPEFYCGNAPTKFDASGALTDEETKKHVDSGIAAFMVHIDIVRN